MELSQLSVLAGSVATTIFVGSYLPMLVKAIRSRDLSSYSRSSLVLANVGNMVQTAYVVTLPVGPIWGLHAFYLLATVLMLLLHLRHAPKGPPSSRVQGPPRPSTPATRWPPPASGRGRPGSTLHTSGDGTPDTGPWRQDDSGGKGPRHRPHAWRPPPGPYQRAGEHSRRGDCRGTQGETDASVPGRVRAPCARETLQGPAHWTIATPKRCPPAPSSWTGPRP